MRFECFFGIYKCGHVKNENKTSKQINKIMTQIKLFKADDPLGKSILEEQVNQFLQENVSTIKVIDIKYTAECPRAFTHWTALVIYETL